MATDSKHNVTIHKYIQIVSAFVLEVILWPFGTIFAQISSYFAKNYSRIQFKASPFLLEQVKKYGNGDGKVKEQFSIAYR